MVKRHPWDPPRGLDRQELLAAITEHMVESVAVVVGPRERHVFSYVNKAWQRMTGWGPEEVIGLHGPSILKSGKQDKAFYDRLWATIEAGETYRERIVNRRKDGSLYDAEISIFLLSGRGDDAVYVEISRDIGERIRSEARLAGEERRFRALVENAFDLIHIVDRDNRIVWASSSLRRILGYDPSEFVGKRGDEFIHPEDREAARSSFVDIVEGRRGPEPIRLRVRRNDGAWRVLEAVGTDLTKDPDVGGFVINSRDVTEAWEAEKALREAQERFERVQRDARFGVWYSDPEDAGKLIWTSGCFPIFGLTPETFDRRVETFFKLVHPEDLHSVREASRAALAGKKRYDVDHRVILPGGEIRWVHQEADVTFDKDGKPLQMVGMVQDIDARKRAEEESRGRAEELEKTLRLLVNREQKMIELKKRLAELEGRDEGEKGA